MDLPVVDIRAVASATRDAPPSSRTPGWLLVMAMRAGKQHVLVVTGEADVSTADQLRSQIVDALSVLPTALVVDLTTLTFCDLHGLDALHAAAVAADQAGVDLQFRGVSPQLSWLERLFPSCPDGRPLLS